MEWTAWIMPMGVILASDGNHAYVTGHLDDAVSWYERNASTGALIYGGMLKDGVDGVDGLDGAYSVTLSSDGNHAYVTGHLDDAVSWYERNASTGALIYGGMLKDGVDGVDGLDTALSVILASDGKHAYVTGVGDDALSWYERNASTGALIYGGMLKDGVDGVDGLDGANSVTLSSDGNHAYVTGQNDDALSWYERNASTGALTYGGMLKDGVDGVDGLDYAYSVTLSSDGNHAYVTGPLDDAVSWYNRDHATGALSYGTATGVSYTLSSEDLGVAITAKAIYTDGGGFSEQVDSPSSLSVELPVMPSPGLIHMGNIKLWLDANHTSSAESTWTDRSSYSNHATKHGSPLSFLLLKNALPIMRYSGSDGEYHSFANIQDIRTVFWVLKHNGGYYFMLGDDNRYHFHRGSNMFNYSGASNNVKNGTLRLNGVLSGTTTTGFQSDMSILSIRTTGNVEASNFSNDRNVGGRYANADLAELIIYNKALTDLEIQMVEGYLAQKWGLTENLPPIHPYSYKFLSINGSSVLTFSENQPAGTTIGEFNATGLHENALLTYHLVSGAGDGNNSSLPWIPTARSRPQPPSITKPMHRPTASACRLGMSIMHPWKATLRLCCKMF